MGKVKRLRKKKSRRQARLEEMRQKKAELRRLVLAERAHREKVLEKINYAETPERRDYLADKADRLRAEILRLKDRIEQLEARQLKFKAIIRRLKKRIRRARRRLRRKKYYASKHFRYDEFDCNDGTPVPEASKPAIRHLCTEYLEPLRAKYGTVHINSGYRHATYNARIGGASNSIHIYDRHPGAVAADHTAAGGSPYAVRNFLDTKGPGGLGGYSTFVHVDNRQRIGWPRARWFG